MGIGIASALGLLIGALLGNLYRDEILSGATIIVIFIAIACILFLPKL